MRVLFDQGTPVPIADYLQEGWDTLANGELLRVAEAAGFEVLLTTDNSLAYQQNLKGWRLVQRMIRKIVAAVNAASPGSYALIDIPAR